MDTTKTYIQVSAHTIKENDATGAMNPPLLVHKFIDGLWEVDKAHEVKVLGPSNILYNPTHSLELPAVVWIETEAEVVVATIQDVL